MTKYRVMRQMFDHKTGRLLQEGEEVELDLTPEDEKSAIDYGVIQPIAPKLNKK